MGVPWKAIGKGLLFAGKSFGGLFVPGLPAAIEAVEMTMKDAAGKDKKAQVEIISDGLLGAAVKLDELTPAQVQAIKEARSEAIDAYVAARNAEAEAREAFDKLQAVIASFKTADADATGEP